MSNFFRRRPLFRAPAPRTEIVVKAPVRKWRFLKYAGKTLRRICTLTGAVVLFSFFMGLFAAYVTMQNSAPKLPDRFVMFMEMKGSLLEHVNDQSPYALSNTGLTIHNVVDALDAAAKDKRVEGFVAVLEGADYSIGHIEEFRAALKRFRASGKFAYIYSLSYGALGSGLGDYYLASAFDQIWMQPMGIVAIDGMKMEVPYARGLLEKIGVEPDFMARKEYKSVFESFTGAEMSEATKEASRSLIDNIGDRLITEMAADRGIKTEQFQSLLNQGLFLDSEAVGAGLVDQLAYVDELDSKLYQDLTGDPEPSDKLKFVRIKTYRRAIQESKTEAHNALSKGDPRLALIYMNGVIVEGAEGPGSENMTEAQDVYAYIMNAAHKKDVQAIVLRINSPGGTPVAAEKIRRAVLKAKEKGKKVIVSMGDVAASGGYWIAADADYIFALPTTLTGSIGVAGGKFVLSGLWEKIGLNWDSISYGDNAGFWSFNEPFTEGQRARFAAMMDNTYKNFVTLVAQGRGMNFDEAEKVARGRVWTGSQAKGKGLVDETGDLNDALNYAAQQAGFEDKSDITIELYPEPLSPIDRLFKILEEQMSASANLAQHSKILTRLKPLWEPLTQHQNNQLVKLP